eukprot:CAMPEP_0184678756 /NCGR_PEP_ID=MMETSP0312-20130426/1548_1 /TAXON_ID=31354 /ORGANISM="Compsopogon coeruleus, Strain SAG 36.94" /LENGTH=161 /DNA_ID=CAMNT_0027127739 /DNA_START=190 /DNA_END=675 /DNA_ORIENTATION=+
MLVPKKNRSVVYNQLFEDGVMVVKKDPFQKKHDTLEFPNLHVMKLCQSLCSRGYLKEQFSWQHYYYFLTDDGIEYLRGYLNIPPEVIPATLKKTTRPPGGVPGGSGMGGDRRFDKRGEPGGDFRPEFRDAGFGRGGGGYQGYRTDPQTGGGYGFGRGGPPS